MKKIFLALTLMFSTMLLWSFISSESGKSNFIEPDSVFVKVAASSSMLEVELGNMAMQKAVHQRVKDFASKMVEEHSRATQELTSLAGSKNFALPATMLRQHSRQVDYLRDATGEEFDRMYMRVMVEEHREDVDEFEDASKKAKDNDVRAWAAKMLPHLRMHLDSARSIRSFVRNNYSYETVMTNNQNSNAANATGTTNANVSDTAINTSTNGTNTDMKKNNKKQRDKKTGGNQ